MAGLKGKSALIQAQLAAIQKRREKGILTEHEESARQQILDGLTIGLIDASGRFRGMECSEKLIAGSRRPQLRYLAGSGGHFGFPCDVMAAADLIPDA